MDSALFKAAISGNVEQVYQLLSENPDVLVDAEMVTADTPIHIAAANGHREFVRTVLSFQPSFAWELNKEGFSAINLATENGHIGIVKDLLMHDPKLQILKDKEGRTPLHCAVIHGNMNIIELLIKLEDCIDVVTARGETILHLALKHNQEDAFVLLMNSVKQTQKQKILDLKDKAGQTVLELAYSKEQKKAIHLITGMQNSGKPDSKIGMNIVKLENSMFKDKIASGFFFFMALYGLLWTSLIFETTQDETYSGKEYKAIFLFHIEIKPSDLDNKSFLEIIRVKEERPFQHLQWIEIDFDQEDKAIQLKTEMKSSDNLDDETGIELLEHVSFILKIPGVEKDRKSAVLHPALFEASLLIIIVLVLRMVQTTSKLTTSLKTHRQFLVPSPFIIYFVSAVTGLCFIGYLIQVIQAGDSFKIGHFLLYEGKSVTTLLIAVASTFSLYHRILETAKEIEKRQGIERVLGNWGVLYPAIYEHADLAKITNNFSREIGRGGFGTVYKGNLQNGVMVAVKMLSSSSSCKEELLVNEVSTSGRIHHQNVVRLLGICLDASLQALIYEYMPNGSLDKLIFCSDLRIVSWEERVNFAIGIAKGLEYLHVECNPRIIHCDIKPENIFLDVDFCPKISDFCVSRLLAEKETVVTVEDVRGTIGYVAPELWNLRNASCKSDVYSFGMMLLEIVRGRRNADNIAAESSNQDYFPKCAYERLVKGEEFGNNKGVDAEIAKKLAIVAFWCIQWDPADRPPIQVVIRMLEDKTGSLTMPPNPFPFPNYPANFY